MVIDWKHLATTPGYRSLKAAYIHDVERSARERFPMRDKDVFLRKFRWVIGRAQHYAHILNVPIEEVLNRWEENRTYWWLNYYQDSHQPKCNPKRWKEVCKLIARWESVY